MQVYDSLTIEFYSAPSVSNGCKPFMTAPDFSVVHSFTADEGEIFAKRPADSYAFRIVPVFIETLNQGLSDEKTIRSKMLSMPLCFLGGLRLDKNKIKKCFGPCKEKMKALEAFGEEFILTKGDILVPFDPAKDHILELQDGEWEQVFPQPQ